MASGKHISSENPNKYKSKKTYTQQLLSTVSHTMKKKIFIIKIGVIVVYKNLFSFASPVGSYMLVFTAYFMGERLLEASDVTKWSPSWPPSWKSGKDGENW